MEAAAFVPSDEDESIEVSSMNTEPDKGSPPKTKEAKLAVLHDKLREAIESEEYERAAKIRDDIKKLTIDN